MTPSLTFALLMMSMFPSGLATFLYLVWSMVNSWKTGNDALRSRSAGQIYLTFYLFILGIISIIDLLIFSPSFIVIPVNLLFGMIFVVMGAITSLLAELSVSFFQSLMRKIRYWLKRKRSNRLLERMPSSSSTRTISSTVNSSPGTSVYFFFILFLLVPIFEEVLFRGVLLVFFTSFNQIAAILLSGLLFALSHVTFGPRTLLQKTLAGIVFGIFFVISGYSILVPILIHLLENVFIISLVQFKLSKQFKEV